MRSHNSKSKKNNICEWCAWTVTNGIRTRHGIHGTNCNDLIRSVDSLTKNKGNINVEEEGQVQKSCTHLLHGGQIELDVSD